MSDLNLPALRELAEEARDGGYDYVSMISPEVVLALIDAAPAVPSLTVQRLNPAADAARDVRLSHRPNEWDSCVTCRHDWPCDAELLAELVLTLAALATPEGTEP